MNNAIISVENLSKRYIIGHRRSKDDGMRHVIEDALRAPLKWLRREEKKPDPQKEEFWALKNVSFDVKQGEVMGLIGRNGAGKSTLLKVLSRITEPTTGRITIDGRVASLLEVGTGFHPELTGRENIFLNGAILGMSRVEIKAKFDEIVAFSEVEKFLDTPVKRYSSGMYVRLAFAVAAHLEPEILIVDEVLAVGDSRFQKKCLGKMREVSAQSGRTVLFVSHNLGALAGLCDRACRMEQGQMVQIGPSQMVINDYLSQNAPSRERALRLDHLPRNSGGDGRLRLTGLEWMCDFPLQHGEALRARIDFETFGPIEDLTIGMGFGNPEGTRLVTYDSDFPDGFRPTLPQPGRCSLMVSIGSLPLAPGIYNLDLGGRSGDRHSLDYLPAAAQIEVVPGPRTPRAFERSGGGVRLSGEWGWDAVCQGALV